MTSVDRRDFLRIGAGGALAWSRCGPAGPVAEVGAKSFSEQLILGEMLTRLIEAEGVAVTPRFQMQTFVLHAALASGDLDCYVEYTGTAYAAIMGERFVPGQTATEIHDRVKQLYRERFDLRLGPPLGFSNDYVVAARREVAESAGLATISDLARRPELLIAAGYPFFERADGFRGMLDYYGFVAPPETVAVDLDMVWQVIGSGESDIAIGNSTDGRIAKLDLVLLEDDRSWFPPYQSAVVYRPAAVPAVARAAERLGGMFDNDTMRRLNERADVEGEAPAAIAAGFLAERGLLP